MSSFNLGAFPLDSVMFDKYSQLFEAGKAVVVTIMPSLIVGRALWNMIGAKGTSEYWDIIKDTIVAAILLACFMSFLRFVLDLPSFFSSLFSESGTYALNASDPEHGLFNDVVNYITIVTFWIAAAIYSVLLILVSAIAAYIIVFGSMLRSSWIIKAFFWVLILISSWPLFWYIANMAIRSLAQEDGFVNGVIIATFNILKALSPLIATIMALRNPLASATKSTLGGAAKLAGGTAALAGQGFNKLGGKPIMDNLAEKKNKGAEAISSTLAKTIPTVSMAAGTVGSLAGRGYKSFAPNSIQNGVKTAAKNISKIGAPFKNAKNLYNGQEIPGSSPVRMALRNSPSTLTSSAKNIIKRSAKSENSQSNGLAGSKPVISENKPISSMSKKQNATPRYDTSALVKNEKSNSSIKTTPLMNTRQKMNMQTNNQPFKKNNFKHDYNQGGRV